MTLVMDGLEGRFGYKVLAVPLLVLRMSTSLSQSSTTLCNSLTDNHRQTHSPTNTNHHWHTPNPTTST